MQNVVNHATVLIESCAVSMIILILLRNVHVDVEEGELTPGIHIALLEANHEQT